MANTINADNGVSSGSAGLKSSSDGTGILALQTNGTTAVTVDASQNVGIGTTTVNGKLNISSAGATGVEIYVADGSSTNNSILSYNRSTSAYNDLKISTNNTIFTSAGSEKMRIDSSGNVLVTNVAGLGYGTGSGGTVTQATSKSTGVTLNKPAGQITMNNAALAAGATATFRLDNSLLSAQDVLTVSLAAADPSATSYQTWVNYTAGGAAYISLKNVSGGSRSEAIIINFALIKVATS